MTKNPTWKKIPDNVIQHVWKQADDDDCGSEIGSVVVAPNWYETNGTPSCDCGAELKYSHTEVLSTVEKG